MPHLSTRQSTALPVDFQPRSHQVWNAHPVVFPIVWLKLGPTENQMAVGHPVGNLTVAGLRAAVSRIVVPALAPAFPPDNRSVIYPALVHQAPVAREVVSLCLAVTRRIASMLPTRSPILAGLVPLSEALTQAPRPQDMDTLAVQAGLATMVPNFWITKKKMATRF